MQMQQEPVYLAPPAPVVFAGAPHQGMGMPMGMAGAPIHGASWTTSWGDCCAVPVRHAARVCAGTARAEEVGGGRLSFPEAGPRV
jgi:hypothetical protein